MTNKVITEKLKKQITILEKLKDWDYDNFTNRSNKTKIYILGLWLDKKDENLRKEVISMIEQCVKEYTKDVLRPDFTLRRETIKTKDISQNILESFIEILELREKSLEAEEKSE